MNEHLPECPVWRCCKPDERATMHMCICPYDERIVGLITRQRAGSDAHRQHEIGWVKGYAAALDAAREAVKRVKWFNEEGKMLNAIVATAESIAAIDALRANP